MLCLASVTASSILGAHQERRDLGDRIASGKAVPQVEYGCPTASPW
jgi:hypothetical protein